MKRWLVLLQVLLIAAASASAQTDIFVQGSGKLFPIALPQLCVAEGESTGARDIPEIIRRDLDLSGYFRVIEPGAYIETPGKCAGPDGFAYSDWTVIGAEGLVKGTIRPTSGGVLVQMYLHDVARQQVVLGKEYEGPADQIPRIAHKFANEIMKFFTGEEGVFGTQIVFSSKVGRFKELFLMDMDGSNVRQLTNDRALSMSSAWDPSGSRVVFTSYRARQPDLFMLNIGDRKITQVTKAGTMVVGAKFGSDGRTLLASVSNGAESDIVLYGLDGSLVRRITSPNRAIDVSPSYSPDYGRIAFCSNRAGGPQIYTMRADGSEAKRLSFVTSNYCTSPKWSPKGDRVAFVCRVEGKFQVFTQAVEGGDALQLTSVGDNEDPDWSPDGRYLAFSSTAFGRPFVPSIALMRSDGSNPRQLTTARLGDVEPAWGPRLP